MTVNKVQSVIVLATFCALAAVYPSAIVGGIVWTMHPTGYGALLAMVATWPVFAVLSTVIMLALSHKMVSIFDDVGEWVTVQRTSTDGKKRNVKVFIKTKRSHEIERQLRGDDE